MPTADPASGAAFDPFQGAGSVGSDPSAPGLPPPAFSDPATWEQTSGVPGADPFAGFGGGPLAEFPGMPAGLDPSVIPAPAAGDFLGVHIPSGDELYNLLMAKIEPELTTDQLPLLEARYKGETVDESKARAHRYEAAFTEYDKQLGDYMEGLKQKLRAHQRIAMSSAELGAKAEEQDALSAIEASIQKS